MNDTTTIDLPNLFKYATSELSQDAFIIYLIKWAADDLRFIDSSLHNCGKKLVNSFLESFQHETINKITSINIIHFEEKIDIACEINSEHILIIEDKIHTSQHSNQLKRYKECVEKNLNGRKATFIYFKTGNQGSTNAVENNGFKPYFRSSLLQILNEYDGINQIINDFKNHWNSYEERFQSYTTTPYKNWSQIHWYGFFDSLKMQTNGVYKKVNNPSGGFVCFFLQEQKIMKAENGSYGIIKIQLEQEKLCLKLSFSEPGLKDKSKSEKTTLIAKWIKSHRNTIYKTFKKQLNALEIDGNKPIRFGSGANVTVFKFTKTYLMSRPDDIELIDVEGTVAYLEKLNQFIHDIAKKITPP